MKSTIWKRPGPVGAVPIMAVHDEIVVQVPSDQAEETKEWVVKAMVDGMKECLLAVPVEVEVDIKETW